MNNERTISKASLVLSDYTLATDPEDRKAFLSILDRYIVSIEDLRVKNIFERMTTTKDDTERDLYIEILGELLEDLNR
ncbi:MAG: hypothetical protein KBT01_04685 [Clostridiales bacterium]|nr:hypothetical protein [Candidatus Blautia equi]